jgi:ribosomal protein L18
MKTVACQKDCFRSLYSYPSVIALFFFSLSTGLAQEDFYQPERSRISKAQANRLEVSTLRTMPAKDSLSTDEAIFGIAESELHHAQKGYWRLRTQYSTRRTIVQIFNSEKRLVYQEQLQGRYLKLNRKNTQMLDKLCDRLLDNQLVASSMKAVDIPEEVTPTLYGTLAPANDLTSTVVLPLNTATLQANAIFTKAGKLKALFINPTKQKITIQLIDKNGESVYTEASYLPQYSRNFELSDLPAGVYTFKIKGSQEHYVRQLRVRYQSRQFLPEWVLQPKQLPMPVIEQTL